MECFVALTALGVMGITVLSALAGVAYTIFWIWMLLDSIVRDTRDYPQGIDKFLWVLLNAFLQPAFVLYYFMVYRATVNRQASGPQAGTTAA